MKTGCLFFLCCTGCLFHVVIADTGPGQGRGVPVQVEDLRCQYLKRPVGIGELYPSFSWKLSSAERRVLQAAYQVTVASSLEKLNTRPDMWNSGKVLSGENTFIRYAGKPLSSAVKYYWRVKVWTNKDPRQAVTGNATYFVTGLLKAGDWRHASWIAYEVLPDSMKVFPGVHGNGNRLGEKAKKRDIIPCFRKGFTIHKKIAQAYVYASGLGQYVLFLNGKRVDSSFLNPAWSDYTKRCYYNSYDVTAALKQGANVIGSIVGNGFFYINRERYRKLTIAAGYPMFRLKMVIRYEDGAVEEITTDSTWKTAPSGITFSSIYGGEDFDAGQVQAGWEVPGFDDHAWRQAVVTHGPGGGMQAQEAYPLIVDDVFTPVSVHTSRKKMYVYDFGQDMSGIIRLKVSGPAGYTVRIIPSELLNDDHTPDQHATGRPYYWQYTLGGNGVESRQPLFSYYGFRYAAVRVFDPKGEPVNVNTVKIISLRALHTQNGAPRTGAFSCSDTLFNRIFQLIRWGIRNNLSHVATDCPHREKLGWLEETHLMGNSIQYNYDILRLYNKIAGDMADAQLPDGLVPDIAPEYVVFSGGFRDSPEWGSACVLVPWYVYQWYGDEGILQKSYAMMKKYLAYLGSKAKDRLLAYGLGDWYDLGPDPPGVSQLTPLGLTATAFYYYDAAVLSRVAAVLGDSAGCKVYTALAEKIRAAFNRKYFDQESNVYATGSQTAYALPLYVGLVDPSRYESVFDNLRDSIRAHHYALTAGDIGFRYVVQVLEQNNAAEVIYKMNNRSDVPGYGYQIKKGATALTESWQALRNVSNDHMMLGHLMEWFYSGLAGIRRQPGSVGYKKILIAPQFVKEINEVSGSYQSMNGLITVHWLRTDRDKVRLSVSIPANATARIRLPAGMGGTIKENGKMPGKAGNGILKMVKKEDVVLIDTGSGEYTFDLSEEH